MDNLENILTILPVLLSIPRCILDNIPHAEPLTLSNIHNELGGLKLIVGIMFSVGGIDVPLEFFEDFLFAVFVVNHIGL
jgi:hypothetical protein